MNLFQTLFLGSVSSSSVHVIITLHRPGQLLSPPPLIKLILDNFGVLIHLATPATNSIHFQANLFVRAALIEIPSIN